jgi:hypothetical protein
MKILFLGRRYTYFRNFDSVLREMAARGHAIHLGVEKATDEGRALVQGLADEFPAITFGEAPARVDDDWNWAAVRVRHGLDHLRYQHRLFDDTAKLRDRSRERTPGAFVALGDTIRERARWARGPAERVLRWLERATPDDPAIRAYMEAHRPDVVLITPLVNLGSSQIDYLRAARAMGLPTALCVWSWDHLSSKALIRELPDRVFVWNETQKREAVMLHRVPAPRVVVTGAQCFDRWFDRQPARDRASFCRAVGLPADRPFMLYVCSAPFIGSAPEAPCVMDWLRRVRAHASPRLRGVPILVRPHPSRRAEWAQVDPLELQALGDVVIWGGDNPIDTQSRADYFDSLHHSSLVVGLNTSAFIEAGIVGRPVHTILLPEWHENQLGTVHFRYLFEAGGGLLNAARSFDEHLQQLDAALAQPSTEIKPFIREFVRPLGLDVAATPVFVDHVEQMAQLRLSPARRPRFQALAHWMLRKGIAARHDEAREALVYSERELETIVRMRQARQAKAAAEEARKHAQRTEKQARVEARIAEREAHRAAKHANKQATKAGAPS